MRRETITSRLISFIEITYILSLREVKSRYKGSVLGPIWIIAYPLALTALTTLVFSIFIKIQIDTIPYPIFALSGIVVWNFFSKSLNLGTKSLLFNRELIVETSVSASAIPLSYIIGQIPDLVVNLLLLVAAMIYYQIPINVLMLIFVPCVYILISVFVYGLSLFFTTLNVLYKDTQNLLEPVLLAWFYLSPIVYQSTNIPAQFHWITYCNPMAVFLNSYRSLVLYGSPPSATNVLLMIVFTILSVGIGTIVYKKNRALFADVI